MSASWPPSAAPLLRQQLDRWMAHGRVAGLQYLVAGVEGARFEHAAGVADAASGQPVCRDTQFNLYSLTKPLTATLVARLSESGALGLDDSIAHAAGEPLLAAFGNLRETLLHRGGFANPMPLRWTHRTEEDARFDEPAFVQRRLADAAARGRVGPRYSNVGYLALGRAVERAAAMGFREAMRRHLIDALNLGPGEHLSFAPAGGASWSAGHLQRYGLLNFVLGGLVNRHEVVDGPAGRWVRLHRHHVDGSAYGGLIGNARGLARFGMAVLGQGGHLDESLWALVCEPPPGAGAGRTLAWFTGRLEKWLWLGHAGGGLGAYGEMRLYPELATVSVLLTNRPGLRDVRALDRLDAVWLRSVGKG